MSTEKGPLTAEMVCEALDVCWNTGEDIAERSRKTWKQLMLICGPQLLTNLLNSAIAPILAAKCALAAAKMREACAVANCVACQGMLNVPTKPHCGKDALNRDVWWHGEFPVDCRCNSHEIRALSIPDEDSLRGLLEEAIEAGSQWEADCSPAEGEVSVPGEGKPPRPTPESILREWAGRKE